MDQGFWAGFRSLDESPDPEALIRFLDAFGELEPVRAGKQLSLDLLDVGPGQAALDVGCGAGADVRELARRVAPDGRVVGVDSSARALDRARGRPSDAARATVDYVLADAARLPFPAEDFDATRADRTLQHVPAPEDALREMLRVTRPGGRVVVSESTSTPVGSGGAELDADIAASVAAALGAATSGGGWAAYFLPVLMRRSGLVDVGVRTGGGRVPAAAARALLAPVEDALERLASSGPGAGDRAAAGLADLRRARKDGRLELDVRLYHFVGWVPDPGGASRSVPTE